MSATDWGVFAPDDSQGSSDDLEQVLFHLGSALSDEQTAKVLDHLDDGEPLSAAELMASAAVVRGRAVSCEDRTTLRRVIEVHGGDLSDVDLLDSGLAARTGAVQSA
ncbi:hypothetical protein [Saccharopolyspora sp. NPDC002376]